MGIIIALSCPQEMAALVAQEIEQLVQEANQLAFPLWFVKQIFGLDHATYFKLEVI